jgi:hypothetical protein
MNETLLRSAIVQTRRPGSIPRVRDGTAVPVTPRRIEVKRPNPCGQAGPFLEGDRSGLEAED